MTFGFSCTCDYGCNISDHAEAHYTDPEAAMKQLRALGWFIDPDQRYALCPMHHREEQANASLGPGTPKFFPAPGEYR